MKRFELTYMDGISTTPQRFSVRAKSYGDAVEAFVYATGLPASSIGAYAVFS